MMTMQQKILITAPVAITRLHMDGDVMNLKDGTRGIDKWWSRRHAGRHLTLPGQARS